MNASDGPVATLERRQGPDRMRQPGEGESLETPARTGARAARAIDCMPHETQAWRCSRGIDDERDHRRAPTPTATGGVCPMLAAHRNGGRTSFASFAQAWDRYTRARAAPRRATERELRTLQDHARGQPRRSSADVTDDELRPGRRRAPEVLRRARSPTAWSASPRITAPPPDTGERDRRRSSAAGTAGPGSRPSGAATTYERADAAPARARRSEAARSSSDRAGRRRAGHQLAALAPATSRRRAG